MIPRKSFYFLSFLLILNYARSETESDISLDKKCVPKPPYLYVTFHGGSQANRVNTVYKYTMDGCIFGNILVGDETRKNFRGLALSENQGHLFLANAFDQDNRITEWGNCDGTGRRRYMHNFTGELLAHPYGLVVWNEVLYISNQVSNAIIRFYTSNSEPVPLPPALANSSYPPGTFAVLKKGSLRGIAVDKKAGKLYIANNDNSVSVYLADGSIFKVLKVDTPIGLFMDHPSGTLYVGSNAKAGSFVYAYSAENWKLLQVYQDINLQHPAGIAVYNDTLYVVSQTNRILVSFDVPTGRFREVVIPNFPDDPEQLLISPC